MSLPPAAARPRLRLGSRRLSAWGAGAAGSRAGRRSPMSLGEQRAATRRSLSLSDARPARPPLPKPSLWLEGERTKKCSWLGRTLCGVGAPSLRRLCPFPAPAFPREGAPAPCEFLGTADPSAPSFPARELSFSKAALVLCGPPTNRGTCRLHYTSGVSFIGSLEIF